MLTQCSVPVMCQVSHVTCHVSCHDCKETPIGLLHAENIGETVLLYVFNIIFPAPTFHIKHPLTQVPKSLYLIQTKTEYKL